MVFSCICLVADAQTSSFMPCTWVDDNWGMLEVFWVRSQSFFFFFLHGGLLGKRRLRWTQAWGNSRHLFPLEIIFRFGQIAQKWGEVAQVRQGRLRNCHSTRLSQFHVGVSLGLMFFLCVCLSVCLPSPPFLFPSPFLFPPVPS